MFVRVQGRGAIHVRVGRGVQLGRVRDDSTGAGCAATRVDAPAPLTPGIAFFISV